MDTERTLDTLSPYVSLGVMPVVLQAAMEDQEDHAVGSEPSAPHLRDPTLARAGSWPDPGPAVPCSWQFCDFNFSSAASLKKHMSEDHKSYQDPLQPARPASLTALEKSIAAVLPRLQDMVVIRTGEDMVVMVDMAVRIWWPS